MHPCGPKLGKKTARVYRLDPFFVRPPPSPNRKGPCPHRCWRESASPPTSLARQVGGTFLLHGARSRYSGVQKLLFGLLMASRKLRHYFQAHEITVVTRFPLKRILQNPEATGRIVEGALELSSFGLKFESTATIQSRALAEFIAEWTPTPDEEIPETNIPVKETSKEWLMYFDGAFSLQGAGAGVLLIAPTAEHLKYVPDALSQGASNEQYCRV